MAACCCWEFMIDNNIIVEAGKMSISFAFVLFVCVRRGFVFVVSMSLWVGLWFVWVIVVWVIVVGCCWLLCHAARRTPHAARHTTATTHKSSQTLTN